MSGGTGVEMLDPKEESGLLLFSPANGSVVPVSQGPRQESGWCVQAGLSGGLHPSPKLL